MDKPMMSHAQPLPVPQRLQRYELQSVLGMGEMAITYSGIDPETQQAVVIKELYPPAWLMRSKDGVSCELRGDKPDAGQRMSVLLRRFREQAGLPARLNQPALVPVSEVLELNGTVYMVMPRIEGSTLEDTVRNTGSLPARELSQYLCVLANVLIALHEGGWVHGDVSPGNIILAPNVGGGAEKTPVLIDLDAARPVDEVTDTLPVCGSAGYAAPECYLPEQQLNRQVDAYALGAVGYFAITGKSPPSAEDRSASVARGLNDPLAILRHADFPAYDVTLLNLINALLALDTAHRPDSVAVVLAALQSAPAAGRIKTRVLRDDSRGFEIVPEQSEPWQSRWLYGALAGLLLVGLAIAAVRYWPGASQSVRTFVMEPPPDNVEASGQQSPPVIEQENPDTLRPPQHFVALPGGRYQMGSYRGDKSAQPVHWVRVKPVWMARYPVTRGEFAGFISATGYRTTAERDQQQPGCYAYQEKGEFGWQATASWRDPGFPQSDQDPVVCVSWEDAIAFARWRSALRGGVFRLPAEAEWEYAARGGDTADSPHINALCTIANVADRSASRVLGTALIVSCDDGYTFTSPVGRFSANAYGLHDLLGNVWEWNADCWVPGYQSAHLDGSARDIEGCQQRVLRGGSWSAGPGRVGYAIRGAADASFRSSSQGFRLVWKAL